jgi:hypothetical protein
MSSQAQYFPGVAPAPPGADRGASALCGGRLFRNTTDSRASQPAHTAIPLSSCIFVARERVGWRGGN